jgi:lysophospholipase L1-like esterase
MKKTTLFLMLFVAAALLGGSGCDKSAPDGPVAGLGGTTVNKYVAIGNSITAGYQSNGLYQSAQIYSYSNLIAQQLKMAGANLGDFQQPLYSDPGSPDATGKASRYEIISLVGPVIGPKGLTPGTPTNTALGRPYDNLGIPGAVVFDFLDTTSFAAKAVAPRSNPMFLLILRQSALGKSMLAQARALNPDLVTFWLGNNDVLGYATSGGVSPSAPTSTGIFAALYAQALDSLRAALPNAKIVVANIPDVRSIPFFRTVGPKMAASIPAPYWLRYQKHGNASVAFDSTKLTEANPPLITLKGMTYATLLGQATGKFYRDNGIPLSPGIDTTKPFGFHPQNPWPDALVLDVDEQNTAGSAVAAYNATIATVAAAKGAGLVDINSFFTNIKANGLVTTAGLKFTADYISGGLFSLDGVHPSSRGSGVIANEFIKVMNSKFGMSVPLVDLTAIPGIPAPIAKSNGFAVIPPEAFRNLELLWSNGGE